MSSENYESTKPETLTRFIGKHFIYTYDNGWQYELYVKNAMTIDYRIHSGMVGGRWVKDQKVHIVRLSDEVFKVSWTEPTGTSVSVAVNLVERHLHGVIFFPQWIAQNPSKTVCFQNDHLPLMQSYRDTGPTYPILVIDEFAKITFLEDCGADNDALIACGPEVLPAGFAKQTN
ncbi:MAG TPA: phenolic acid decarboxylase [Telmatospirillum sp.]|nr:phenolic acid decarboxylase [Telmatospirillum sp.]